MNQLEALELLKMGSRVKRINDDTLFYQMLRDGNVYLMWQDTSCAAKVFSLFKPEEFLQTGNIKLELV